ncbi:unnamed protein product [Lathyrus sativus]|nr:unnamed protein product [Lathyrus sativus]
MTNATWTEVRQKQSKQVNKISVWTAKLGNDHVAGKHLSYFFFTEFPESYNAKEMAEMFKDFGLLSDVFILERRDKRGRRYSFARFRKVYEERLIVARLDSIQIKGKKIFANVPRFQRVRVRAMPNNTNKLNLGVQQRIQHRDGWKTGIQGKSFVQ